jgi:hypothetical protein
MNTTTIYIIVSSSYWSLYVSDVREWKIVQLKLISVFFFLPLMSDAAVSIACMYVCLYVLNSQSKMIL